LFSLFNVSRTLQIERFAGACARRIGKCDWAKRTLEFRFSDGSPKKITSELLVRMLSFYPSRRLGMESMRLRIVWNRQRLWHHAQACIRVSLRLNSIRDFVAIPYRNKLRIPSTATP